MMMRNFLGIVALLSVVGGCGGSGGLERAGVEGTVTLNGQNIERGSISFSPVGTTKGPTVGGTIENGRYSIPAERGPVLGQYIVEIRAPKETGRKIPDPYSAGRTMNEVVEPVPKRYNSQSELQREIKSGFNNLDFEMITFSKNLAR